jgi:predicted GH43/DUF377 family glycosyl hydrolase
MTSIFTRHPRNPILPAVPGTWREDQTANPDLLRRGDTFFLYFRGQRDGHDRIGVATIPADQFDGATWHVHPTPVIDVGPPGSWDSEHALDPATVEVEGRIFLYYSAVSPLCPPSVAPRCVCAATSTDGFHFTKHPGNPVIIGGGGPEVVWRDGVFHLYYWREVPGRNGFELHLATSTDGFDFTPHPANPVLPVGPAGAWDSHTVETPRITAEDGVFYLFYSGSDRHDDYPAHAGLATSRDLVHWTKSPRNPVFARGEAAAWDEGAIWFTTVERVGDRYYLWYEGYGGGDSRAVPYGSYLREARSQVGLATAPAGPGRTLAHLSH